MSESNLSEGIWCGKNTFSITLKKITKSKNATKIINEIQNKNKPKQKKIMSVLSRRKAQDVQKIYFKVNIHKK